MCFQQIFRLQGIESTFRAEHNILVDLPFVQGVTAAKEPFCTGVDRAPLEPIDKGMFFSAGVTFMDGVFFGFA